MSTTEKTTREKILDVALELFSKSGANGASIRQIASAVGVRESSIYNHFQGKAAIYTELLSQWGPCAFVEKLESESYRALSNNPQAFFTRCGEDLIERWMDLREQQFLAMISREPEEFSEGRLKFHDALFSRENEVLAEYFVGFSGQGLVRSIDARETARIFSSGLICLRLEHVSSATGVSPRPLVEAAMKRYLDSFWFLVRP